MTVFYFSNILGYIKSNIPVSAIIHCIEETHYKEDEMGNDYLDYFRHSKGTIEALRNSADAAVLLVTWSPEEGLCGKGFTGIFTQ